MWQNSKNLNVTKKILLGQKSKTQIVANLKKLKMWQDSETQIFTKLNNSNITKLKKIKCDKLKKINLWQISLDWIVREKKLINLKLWEKN